MYIPRLGDILAHGSQEYVVVALSDETPVRVKVKNENTRLVLPEWYSVVLFKFVRHHKPKYNRNLPEWF